VQSGLVLCYQAVGAETHKLASIGGAVRLFQLSCADTLLTRCICLPMKTFFQFLVLVMLPCLLGAPFTLEADEGRRTPDLLLANIYQPGIELSDYWVSEKLDGVRAYWDGQHLLSRQGNVIHAPEWFVRGLPNIKLDGELWSGRQQFDRLSGIVRRQSPQASDWSGIKYMIFDLPGTALTFDQRLKQLDNIVRNINAPHIQLVQQYKVSSHEALMQKLELVVNQGAEGLMLHRGSSIYQGGRLDDLLKLKQYQDAEAVVIKHLPGKGKYRGMLGSIEVETVDGKRFKIGSGFSDAERKNPPAIGATITYKYFGLTSKGIPRFASFLRVRTY